MNKAIKYIVAAALFAAVGCTEEDDGSVRVRVDSIRSAKTVSFGEGESEVSATAKVNVLMPVEEPLHGFVERNIALNWKRARGEDGELVSGYKAAVGDFLSEFRESKSARAEKIEKDEWVPPSSGWDFALDGVIAWTSRKYFSYRSSIMSYFGGVHPDIWYKNGTYSHKLGRRMVVEDLIDRKDFLPVAQIICKLISEDESRSDYLRGKMTNDVSKTYAEYAGDTDEEGRGDASMPCVTENFMIVEEGIVWTYNEYEISSYSEGHTDVCVPWHLLIPYLKSKELLDDPEVVSVYERMRQQAIEEGRLQKIGGLEFF